MNATVLKTVALHTFCCKLTSPLVTSVARPYTFTPPFGVKCQHHSAARDSPHASSSNTSCRNESATKHGHWHSCRTVSGATLFLSQFGGMTHAYQANLRTLVGPDRSPQRSYLLHSSFPLTQADSSNQQSLTLNGNKASSEFLQRTCHSQK